MRAPAPRPVHTYQREATPSEHAQWDKAAPKLGLPVGKAGTAVDLWLNKQVRKVYLKTINVSVLARHHELSVGGLVDTRARATTHRRGTLSIR